MTCPTCGHRNPEGARFCGSCATQLVAASRCPNCGASNSAGQTFCNACGQALRVAGEEHAPENARSPTPPDRRSEVPEHLAEKIRAGRGALEGERKAGDGAVRRRGGLDGARRARASPRSGGGSWSASSRSSATASTGSRAPSTSSPATASWPSSAPRSRTRTTRSAPATRRFTFRRSSRAYAAELRRERGSTSRCAWASTPARSSSAAIGDDLRMEYTAIGHTVGLAQRMEQLAEPGKAYLTSTPRRSWRVTSSSPISASSR